jgi:hypothetical protein
MKEHDLDVLGCWPPEQHDFELAIIDNMLAQLQETIHKFIQLKRAVAEANDVGVSEAERAAIAASGVLWPKFVCAKLERKR